MSQTLIFKSFYSHYSFIEKKTVHCTVHIPKITPHISYHLNEANITPAYYLLNFLRSIFINDEIGIINILEKSGTKVKCDESYFCIYWSNEKVF